MAANHRTADYRKNNCRFSRVEDILLAIMKEVTNQKCKKIIKKHLDAAIVEEKIKASKRLHMDSTEALEEENKDN